MEYRDIKGYEGIYMISEDGEVIATRYKEPKVMKPFHKTGNMGEKSYLRVQLSKHGKPKKYSIHRLVADAFVENSHNKDTVNHIDGNKFNNHYTNLEWVTQRENNVHAYANGLKSGAIGRKFSNNKSGYVGVCKEKNSDRWRAQLRYNKELIYLGLYDTPELASIAYNNKFQELYGGLSQWL